MGPLAVDDGTQHQHLGGHPDGDEPWQPLRTTPAREHAEFGLGQTEPGLGCRDPQVARHCEFEPSAQRTAVDRGDHRQRAGDEDVEGVGEAMDEVREIVTATEGFDLFDVGARAERPACPVYDHRAH